MRANAQFVTGFLGIAGLVPFVVPALLVVSGSALAAAAAQVAAAYALAIVCFLAGSWWGMAQAPGIRATLLLSNVYLLLALGLYLSAIEWWPLAAMLLLLGAWVCEQNKHLFPALPPAYRHLRTLLTLVAAGSMGVIQFSGWPAVIR
jgi:hypothetical protein